MRYTLEIQKLLLQTPNNNLHPREKANLLKEAIRIADENEDVEWATELRLDLIYELNLLSADAEEITVFSKILDDYENHKDVIKEDDLLWKYKWIWACTFDLPEIPMEQVQAIGEDYKTRILRNGYSLRSYYHRWSVECVWMRQYDKAKEYIDKMLNDRYIPTSVHSPSKFALRSAMISSLAPCATPTTCSAAHSNSPSFCSTNLSAPAWQIGHSAGAESPT